MKYFIGFSLLLFFVSIYAVKKVELLDEGLQGECKKISEEFEYKMDEIHKSCDLKREQLIAEVKRHCWDEYKGDWDAIENCVINKKGKETELYNLTITCIDQKLGVLREYKDKLKKCQPLRKANRGGQKKFKKRASE